MKIFASARRQRSWCAAATALTPARSKAESRVRITHMDCHHAPERIALPSGSPKQAHAGNELRRDKAPACKARFSNQDRAWRSAANSHPIYGAWAVACPASPRAISDVLFLVSRFARYLGVRKE